MARILARRYYVRGFTVMGTQISVVLILVISGLVRPAAAQDHGYTPADIENGGRLYQSSCAGCHGQEAPASPASSWPRPVSSCTSDTDLIKIIQAGIPGTAMPPHNFTDQEAGKSWRYLRNMATVRSGAAPTVLRGVGDAARGRALFEGKGQCTTCHRVNGEAAPRAGPERSRRDAAAARAAPGAARIPNATMRAGNRFFQVVTSDGRTITGRLMNQDSFSIQMLDSNERLVSLPKSALREYGFVRTSPMPSVQDKLSRRKWTTWSAIWLR